MTEASLEQNMAAARHEHLVPGREIHMQDMRGYGADLKPFSPALWHEWVRTGVAIAITGAVIAETLILAIAFVQGHLAASGLSAAAAAIVTPLVGIAGTGLGCYLGTHRITG